jgi:HK97 family phage major capsid protein
MPKILTEIPLTEEMPAGAVVDVPQETYDHLKQLQSHLGDGVKLYDDWNDETEAKVKARKEAEANEQKEQDAIIEAMAAKSLSQQIKTMFPDIDQDVQINVAYQEPAKKENGPSGAFKSFGHNVQMAAALLGLDFKGADQLRNHWKNEQKQYAQFKAITGQSESVDADGGFLVDDFFDRDIVSRMMETSLLYRDTDLRQIGVGHNGMKWNGRIDYDRTLPFTQNANPLRVRRTGEGETKQATKFTLEQFSLKLLKLVGLNFLTDELLEDVPTLEAEVREWFNEEFGLQNDNEVFAGTGGTQMQGVLDGATTARIDVALNGLNRQTAAGAGGAPTIEEVLTMYARLAPRSKMSAKWYNNPLQIVNIAQMAIGNMPVYMAPGNGLTNAPFGAILGLPVVDIEQASAIGTLGDINLWDLSQFRTIQKGGVKIDRSTEVRFLDDETVLRFVMRNNGIPKWSNFMTLANGEQVSPFVSLASAV